MEWLTGMSKRQRAFRVRVSEKFQTEGLSVSSRLNKVTEVASEASVSQVKDKALTHGMSYR